MINQITSGGQIKGLAVYHPSSVKENDYYIEHFLKQGQDITHFLEDVLGRKSRYVIEDSKENSLTMAIIAAKEALEKADLTGKDMDMICLATNSAEYVVPPTAMFIHQAIGAGDEAICYDINVNCLGMTFAMDQAMRYMQTSKRVNRVLIVGSEYLTLTTDPTATLPYSCFGDSACAMILEKTEEASGLLDTRFYVNSMQVSKTAGPRCGFSHSLDAAKEEIYYKFEPADCEIELVAEKIKNFLAEYQLKPSDINSFCFSQFAYANVAQLKNLLNLQEDQVPYVGDRYGYTGSNSPFVALYETLEKRDIKRGDYIFIWTIGAATQHIFTLLKY